MLIIDTHTWEVMVMRKILLVLLCCFFCMPVWSNAQTNMAYIFGASDAGLTNTTLNGNSVSIKNEPSVSTA